MGTKVQHLALLAPWECVAGTTKNNEGANLDTEGRFTIGQLARAAGVNIATIRYYQRRNLLRVPEQPRMGGYRLYGERDLRQLSLIKEAKTLGFTLTEITGLTGHVEAANCDAVRTMAETKLRLIKQQVGVLNKARRRLGALLAGCTHDHDGACPLLLTLRGSRYRQVGVACTHHRP